MNNLSPSEQAACEFCHQAGGEALWRDAQCRIVLVGDPDYAGFCRVIWNAHVREMTDLCAADQAHCMRVVLAVERALRNTDQPHKINLAAFGNMTPHLHWHVIPRHVGDAHFPNPVWGERQRPSKSESDIAELMRLRDALAAELSNLLGPSSK